MNTITTTASTSTILAIDLGKYKSVACLADQATGEFRLTICATTRAELLDEPQHDRVSSGRTQQFICQGRCNELVSRSDVMRPWSSGTHGSARQVSRAICQPVCRWERSTKQLWSQDSPTPRFCHPG